MADLKELDVLLGRWEIIGRSHGALRDDVFGTVTVTPILSGTVLQLAGTIRVGEDAMDTVELVWADPHSGELRSHAYSSLGPPLEYRWRRTGPAAIMHAGAGATYHGTVSDDGCTITGSWVPDPGQPVHAGSSYESTMRRID